ncbi:nucleotidyltransferase domain-containing protein [Acetobacter orientalis]|uniref:nucleotidyltransferase family protein n=1 Tax=Acetobacter orientalis TaxID=146474 RepID=UPI0020A2DCBF|nr:nucleotidyltransferase domain-containing protein [Acetobacter orientalis]MCP1220444.1 nucleotidyltransferase domain-containing protein [Acetobacter orientalis]
MISALALSPEETLIVTTLLKECVPDKEVWVFGSRAKGTAKPYSDLDLAVIGEEPLPLLVRVSLEEAFSSSLLPWKVDVLDWATTDAVFRDLIQKDHIVIQAQPSNI